MKQLHTDTNVTKAMADASPQMLDALLRITHPWADDDDVEYALMTIRKARGLSLTRYEDVRESCRDKCAADAVGGNFWSNR